MDRALNIDTLTSALGTHTRLPSPNQLQQLLADTEIALFTQQAEMPEGLLDSGWYLQSIAASRPELQLYPLERRRLAHQISAHIFDLALQSAALQEDERLRYAFACQIGYLGGDLTPNATAIVRRLDLPAAPYDWPGTGAASLQAGILLLALNRSQLFPLLNARREQLRSFERSFGDLALTNFDAVNSVIAGIWDLTVFLTYGQRNLLERAAQSFTAAVQTNIAEDDIDSRWVAAHLLNMTNALGDASVWSVLPPDRPAASRAMTLGDPPVLLLWPPQLSFLQQPGQISPLDPSIKRLILSFPTSAGKSLLAQLFVITQLLSDERGICVVAPTHSLCRELSVALERRLRTLGYELYEDGPLGLYTDKPPGARVVVMTPEKLAARLRTNPAGLLQDFGMFVVDEAHLLADGERGWRLEETISFLHHLTKTTGHRILVLSAALGNQAHVVAWIDSGEGVVSRHENWRGPRRLNVVYTTQADWPAAVEEPARGNRQARQRVPLTGILRLKTPINEAGVGKQFTEPVGQLVRRLTPRGYQVDGESSTERSRLIPLIVHVAASGPVLIVEATRTEAQRLAEELYDRIDEGYPSPFSLVDTVRTRMGPDHLLSKTLTKGVAFHHSALPIDIQAELEDAVRNGDIRCLVATTTLTEGVNLPFKTVIIGHRGYQSNEGYVELVDPARLLNAIGRAGRAGRESEGWLILAEHAAFNPTMFKDLERTGEDLELRSTLLEDTVLEALARFEEAVRAGADAILANDEAIADGFISYVWFIADALEELNGTVDLDAVTSAIRDTLAWRQADDARQQQFLTVADLSFRRFNAETTNRRRRWARAGTSLPSAATLDATANLIFTALGQSGEVPGLTRALEIIISDGRLATLLGLTENPKRGFKARRNDPRDQFIAVNVEGLLLSWLGGTELQALADQFLGAINDAEYRQEQLAEFVASVFEHHIPWTIGIITGWVNSRLEETDSPSRLPEHLPGAIHFGVSSLDALTLMLGGVRSRRLANRVAADHAADPTTNPLQALRGWLANQDITTWRERFGASPTEILDLLGYTRTPEARLVSDVLAGNAYRVRFNPLQPINDGTRVSIEPEPEQASPAPLVLLAGGEVIGRVGPQDHDDISLLRQIGIPLEMTVETSDQVRAIEIKLAENP